MQATSGVYLEEVGTSAMETKAVLNSRGGETTAIGTTEGSSVPPARSSQLSSADASEVSEVRKREESVQVPLSSLMLTSDFTLLWETCLSLPAIALGTMPRGPSLPWQRVRVLSALQLRSIPRCECTAAW